MDPKFTIVGCRCRQAGGGQTADEKNFGEGGAKSAPENIFGGPACGTDRSSVLAGKDSVRTEDLLTSRQN
jgi:hypothetical protein